MLVTPVFTLFSLALNLGTLLLLNGSDPNFVTTRRNLRACIQTIESAAMKSWSEFAKNYEDIVSPLPTSSTPSFYLADHAEWIYRGCAIRILGFLDSSVSHSPRTPSPPFASPTLSSAPISTDVIIYVPLLPSCPISSAPFVVDHAEHPWATPGVVEVNFPDIWSFVLCVLVSFVTHVWLKVVHSLLIFSPDSPRQFQTRHLADAPDTEVEPTYEARDVGSVLPPSSYVGSVATFTDMGPDSDLGSEFGTIPKPQVFTDNVGTSSPLHYPPAFLPVVVTTSDGRILFTAEITLPPNQTISISPSSVRFSVDVVAFRSSFSRKLYSPSRISRTHFFGSLRWYCPDRRLRR